MRVLWPAADDQRRRAVLLCLAVALWVAPEATAQRSDSRLDRILDAYGQGDASAASVELATVSNYEKFGIEFPQHASRWIQSAPEGKKDFRRRVAALFTLELAHATLPTPRIWIRVREIMEWGCEQIRSGQPTPFERTWLLAADTLIQGAGDNDLGEPHARHSQQRFPDEPRFRLAEAVARREAKITANRPGAPTRLLAYGTLDVRRDLSKVRLAGTIARLTALRDDPVVGPEARLRLGILYFHLGRLAESLSELQAASRASADPFATYLAYLLSGQVLEFQQEHANAISAYRSAVAIFPQAASGLSALASLLFLTDDRDGAADLYARMVATHPPAVDPWREFGFGSYRFWSGYIEWLRREVRR